MNQLPESSPEFFRFVKDHSSSDLSALMLKYHTKSVPFDIESSFIQIRCRQKTARKLRNFIDNDRFLFPTSVSAEQASHQAVAIYHASLIPEGSSLLDMTAGLGIDVLTMAEKCSQVTAIDIEPLKTAFLCHNCRIMNLDNLEVITADSIDWLKRTNSVFDIIFIDPARRDSDNKRAYNFHDCMPDVMANQGLMRTKGSKVFIKASPLLDITQTLRDIANVRSIRAVCVEGECKEILIETAKGRETEGTPDIDNTPSSILKEAVDLDENGALLSRFSFHESTDDIKSSADSVVYASETDLRQGHHLYEPNAAIMKLAPWKELILKYDGLKKLAPSSHLFVSSNLYEDFPGRILVIEKLVDKKDRKTLKGLPVNVAVRNYPVSAENLRKQLSVKEGSDLFLYGTRLSSPVLILAKKLQNLKPAVRTI